MLLQFLIKYVLFHYLFYRKHYALIFLIQQLNLFVDSTSHHNPITPLVNTSDFPDGKIKNNFSFLDDAVT